MNVEPVLTPDLIRQHGLSDDEFARCRQILGRDPNYTELDRPTVQRKRAVGDGVTSNDSLEELLDIPAFLRRQAD